MNSIQRNISSLLILTIALSCGDKLSELKKDREDLKKKIAELNAEVANIDREIEKLAPEAQSALLVSYQEVKPQTFEHIIDLQSSITTDQNVMVYPEFSGTLKLYVTEGQRVSAGQVIGEINDGGMSQQLAQARIQASLAQTAYIKQQNLWNQKIGSEIQYLQAKTNAEAAQKQVAALQSQLGRTKVKAPFSGVVDKVITQNGQVVGPGMPILQLVNLGKMKVEADVPETYIGSVKSGSPVHIVVPNLNRKISTKISKVGNSINQMNRTFNVEVNIPNPDGELKPNMTAKLQIVDYQNSNAITVPTNIIKQDAQNKDYIYTFVPTKGKEGKAKKTLIVKGKTSGELTEVLMGLAPNDKVIVEGANRVSDGRLVTY